jgi:surfeit locus 1 family protein
VNNPTARNTPLRRLVPPLAAVVLVIAFANLGTWQLDRAAEKEALAASFADDAPHRRLDEVSEPTPFEKLTAGGRLLGDRQVLIDNIVRNGRLGYFVITALETAKGAPLLLVNRGWIPRGGADAHTANAGANIADAVIDDIAVNGDWRTLRGRAGNLPRVGIRSGEAFEGGEAWPRIAVYPTAEEVAAELGRDVLPFALLLDPDQPDGFSRVWEPRQSGAMTHYGYAFQWFAMALAVVGISAWQLRKRWLAR